LLKDAWTLAIETLSWVELQRLGERLALAKAAKQLEINDPKVVGLAHKLVFETLRRLNVVDSLLDMGLAPRSLSDFKLGVQSFLRLYTYQVVFEGADYEEAVAMAHTGRTVLGWHQLNDVEEALGNVLSARLTDVFKGASDEERVALQTYNPTWFVKYSFKMLGRREALNFLESTSDPTPTYVRLNTLKASEEDSLRKMEEDVVVEKEPHLNYTYRVAKSQRPLTRTKGFSEGLFYVQDKASCLAVEVANPKADDTVIDVCAAPGAKTTYMAQLMQNKGKIYSIDYSRRRMNVWKREIKRMGVENATAIVADAQKFLPAKLEEADLVVLDPPCTSTGAFSKTPSAKWRLTKRSVFNMARVQWNMLNNCAEKVKEGGHLLYSTCSVSLEENEMLIEKFLKWNLDCKLVETTPRIGLPGFRGQSQCQRLFPHLHGCNGFFVAKLLRKS